ncbi:hypothetical protein FC961_10675 [Clostridium botulinum]|nr:hypothetical protein [Clostridium botulinum]NFO92193.1 hypothetical protein [Clostridium botulinum]
MSDNIFVLDIPNFSPQYENDVYYSYKGKGGENLKELLTKTSQGYCMYCYSRILVDRKNYGELEHSIEKVNSEKLVNCASNISIACLKCNRSFKKKGDTKRRITKKQKVSFEKSLNCSSSCTTTCNKYLRLREIIQQNDEGKIIFQPFGTKNVNTDREYLIQYDILNQKFIPSMDLDYNEEEKEFIAKHINRFNLNDTAYRTKEFINFCKDVFEYKTIPKKRRYSNLIVDLFIDKLQGFSLEESIKVCTIIYNQIIVRNKG